MRRRAFIAAGVTWGALSTIAVSAVVAAGSDRVFRIGILMNRSIDAAADAFVAELNRLGYAEGRNLALDWRPTDAVERNAALAAELIALKPDILVGIGSEQARALKAATSTIAIVFANVSDPVGLRIVDNLPRPGGNVTGIANYNSELAPKRLEMIGEIVPGAQRIAILFNPANPASAAGLKQTEMAVASSERKLVLLPTPARAPAQLPSALERVTAGKADALIVVPDLVVSATSAKIIAFALHSRLPAIFSYPEQAAAGALISYGVDRADGYRRAAAYVDKILKGAAPADLPIEQPTKLTLVVNLKTARALGLTVPPSLLARADEVIE
jgi:putative ABC transport system substrate-binding protein